MEGNEGVMGCLNSCGNFWEYVLVLKSVGSWKVGKRVRGKGKKVGITVLT
jgi:hypothetical protein